ncbi:ABC transporter permease [Halorubrum distributum]|uniref:ABC transporter permease subunit n=1 Tax=Halorubrum distributum TaxID=29283 RepID=A0A6B1ILS5_9EURY|nr:ABC transporter permease [Halorubrum terrestre]MYL16044.1 ABC transporter permease subunit [Halorubrum terrestre]MYL68330.1 ABC transporter permease subunit [Halorubrum terrestre]
MSDSRGRSEDGTGEATRPDGGHPDATAAVDALDGGPEVDAADSESAATAAAAETSTNDGVRGALRHVFVVAVTEYRLAVRSRWALALTALFVVFGGVMLTFSGSAVGPAGAERVVASLTSLAAYLVPLAALALGYDAIVGREEEGWLAVVFSLPVRRSEVVAGTYLGRLAVLAGATVLGFGFSGALIVREFGVGSLSAFLGFLGGTVGVGAAFLAVALLLSTVAREKTHALGAALLVWVWFVLVHDLLALGIVAATELPDAALSALVLSNPVSAFRVFVLSGLGTTAGGGFTAVLAGSGLSTVALAASLVAWTIVPVAVAARLVRRRRL